LALFIMYSRVYLNCHTVQQVIIGGLFGILFGTIGFTYKPQVINTIKNLFKF